MFIEQLQQQLKAQEEALQTALDSSRSTPVASASEDGSIAFVQAMGPSSTQRAAPAPVNVEESRFMSSVNQLSVSSIHVPECKPLDGDEEIYRYSYESWKELLEDTLRLAGVEDEATKFTIFKIKAGPRLLQIYRNTKSQPDAPDATIEPFSNAMHRLRTYFGSGSDVMLQRRKLAIMKQKPGESSLTFITRVGDTARLCEFGENKEFEEIVGVIAEHAMSREVRVAALKMLSRKGTFANLVDKVRELEAIRINEEFFKQNHSKADPAMVAPVSASYSIGNRAPNPRLNYRRGRFQQGATRRREERFNPIRGFRSTGSNGPSRRAPIDDSSANPDRCWRCNSVYHLPSACSAADKTCLVCGRKGHIRRACRSSAVPRTYKSSVDNETRPVDTTSERIAAVEKMESAPDAMEVSEPSDI